MSNVRRVYVEKKPEFAVNAKGLQAEIKSYLGIGNVTKVRELVRYDIENISEDTYIQLIQGWKAARRFRRRDLDRFQ